MSARIASAVGRVRDRIAAAADRAGRDVAAVSLVAVTKTVEVDLVLEVIRAGVSDIGENRVQEAIAKRSEVALSARWHLIGHLQSNKAAPAARAFEVVHSLDSPRLAAALDRHLPEEGERLAVMLQVDLTGLPRRAGVRSQELPALASAVEALKRLRLVGLMTMAPLAPDPEAARPYFHRLRELRDELEQGAGLALPELSMGMSEDFEVAVEEGATMVRIGRAIFGERAPVT